VLRGVEEPAAVDTSGVEHELARRGQVAEDARPDLQPLLPAGAHLGEAPHRHPSPTVLGGEEAPVGHRLAEHRVGDVVGRQPERRDAQLSLTGLELGWVGVEEAAAVKVVLGNQEVHVAWSLRAWPRRTGRPVSSGDRPGGAARSETFLGVAAATVRIARGERDNAGESHEPSERPPCPVGDLGREDPDPPRVALVGSLLRIEHGFGDVVE